MKYANDLCSAMNEAGILWSSSNIITEKYIAKVGLLEGSGSEKNIKEMIEEGIEAKQIVMQNSRHINKHKFRELPHYTLNNLPEGVPYTLLNSESELYRFGHSPREIIENAQEMIETADDKNYAGVKAKIVKLERSADFAGRILLETMKLGKDVLSKTYPALDVDKEAMDGFRSLVSGGLDVVSHKKGTFNEELREIENARERVASHTEEEIEAVRSLDLNLFSDKQWKMVVSPKELDF